VPSDPADTRRSNRSRLLQSIITRGPVTRAELSRRLSLSRPTISVIVNELLSVGVITEGERVSSGGAPGTLLEISKKTGVIVVADLRGPDSVILSTVSASGGLITTDDAAAVSTEQVQAAVTAFVERCEPHTVIGVVLCVPGLVARGEWSGDTQRDGQALALGLRRALRLPVFAVNAAEATAIAELRDSPNDVALATVLLDDQVSMALVLGGRLHTGVRRPTGDIAHLVPGTPGPRCEECGHACLQHQLLVLWTDPTDATMQNSAIALAAVLAPVAAGVELTEVVLSGFPEQIAADLAGLTKQALRDRMLEVDVPAVRASQRGTGAAVIGAAALMLYRILG
jgi:predicted NBD/HSP70 family sugar kinase